MTTWTVSRSWSAASCPAARWTRRTSRARSPRAAAGVRPPVVPPWLASRAALAASLTWAAKEARYHAGFHAVRAPKYAVKTVVYAVPGALRTIGAAGPVGLGRGRQLAPAPGRRRPGRRRAVAGAGCPPPAAGPLALARPDRRRGGAGRGRWRCWRSCRAWRCGGCWCWPPLVAAAARAGRPADKPITDRVSQGKAYRKLTAELVRRALLSVQLAGINSAVAKDPNAITFPTEIHRDGPGHLAVVDLPYGVEAADVIARRGRLASGLRLPLDQVWPEPAPGHTGRLALWVGHEPASQMRQPAWPLLRGRHGGRVQAVRVRHHPPDGAHRRVAGVPELAVRRPARIGQVVGPCGCWSWPPRSTSGWSCAGTS